MHRFSFQISWDTQGLQLTLILQLVPCHFNITRLRSFLWKSHKLFGASMNDSHLPFIGVSNDTHCFWDRIIHNWVLWKKIIKALLFIVCSLRLVKCHAIATIFYGKEHYCQDFSKLDQPKRIFLSRRRPAIFIICESPRV